MCTQIFTALFKFNPVPRFPCIFILFVLTARKRSLGQGNIFTSVCHSVQGGVACVQKWGACVVKGGCVVKGACMGKGGVCGKGGGTCMAKGDVCGEVGVCVVKEVCMAGGGERAWQERQLLQRAVRILLECILVF